ncbi:AAEL001617-PA [Aedes aegypti]|uniref:AAEL001617-PA n=2 Tax=Aedes aegypti TaxID=7159 RepID=A0A1S7UEJ7_AEDAE|nr:AAEL001617-PA [Aedes aegypti]DAA80449.1 TPA_exp: odorant receptor 124 [Aedes aegypti]
MLNVLLLCAGIRTQLAVDWTWERPVRYLVHLISAYHSVVMILQAAHVVAERNDVMDTAFCLIKIVGMGSAYIKILLLTYHADSVDKVEHFIRSRPMSSGEDQYDSTVRGKFLRSTLVMIRWVLGVLIVDEILFAFPNSQRNKLFKLPPAMSSLGTGITGWLANFLFVNWMPLIWLSKYLCCTTKLGVLLMGLRVEFKILTHKLEQITRQAKSIESVEDHCKFLKKELEVFLYKQAELRRIDSSFVGNGIFMIYYYALFFIGTMLYVTHHQGFEFYSLTFASSVVVTLLECYWWCQLVDSFQDDAESMGNELYDICAGIPYARQSHRTYVEMRTSLMIIWINARHSLAIDCVGIFSISTAIFVQMLNTSYSVLMFLINMG